ncbi:50S ribosomal protein L11 methyltransferase [Halalkalibacter urbisdiaboli]|uniref:50S ribosomal protein L11 methyltransferase n=1 Tax=Halalkalibacter urbisdiaboli TaxID=1960589 RepID=UPI000B449B89|nr:50S ribosomal protein L11 methyltransferase [Halalkalibacter urbisdiaboli]
MLHEFSVSLPFDEIESAIERLTIAGFYHLYYDQPFDIFEEANGYGAETVEEPVELKVFVEDTEIKNSSVDAFTMRIANALNIHPNEITYDKLDNHNDWQQPFPTIDLGNGWQIRPPSNSDDQNDELKEILFEPPRAFGSGLHETTQDCLKMILNEQLNNQKALDLGTGSGLLSVAASLVGAKRVVSIDIEDVKTEVLYNAKLNNIDTIEVLQANVIDPSFFIDESFDFIFANVAANENKELLDFIKSHLHPEGKVILSGMVEWNYREVIDLYLAKGFFMKQMVQNNEWVTAYMEKIKLFSY